MQEPYKRILERRRSQIVEQVKWRRDFTAALERYGLLSKEELRLIEMDFNGKTRMFAAVSRVLSSDEAGTFDRFRRLLIDTGDTTMAESLDFDRQRIQWDFEKPSKVSSLGEYIDLINADLLEASVSQQEDDVRRRMVLEAKRRLDLIRTTLRQQQLDRDQLRLALLRAAGTQLTKPEYDEQFNADRLSPTAAYTDPGQLRNIETDKDQAMAASVLSSMTALRSTVTRLQADNRRLRRLVNDSAAVGIHPADAADDQVFDEREDDDDDESSQTEAAAVCEQFICIPRSQYDMVTGTLRVAANAVIRTPPEHESCGYRSSLQAADQLVQLAQTAADELERWRRRAQQLSADVRRPGRQSVSSTRPIQTDDCSSLTTAENEQSETVSEDTASVCLQANKTASATRKSSYSTMPAASASRLTRNNGRPSTSPTRSSATNHLHRRSASDSVTTPRPGMIDKGDSSPSLPGKKRQVTGHRTSRLCSNLDSKLRQMSVTV